MTKYIVRSICRATDANENFKGESRTFYQGKGGWLLGSADYVEEFEPTPLMQWEAREWGYNRISDAKRSFAYRNPQNDEHWRTKVEIIPIEV